MVTRVSTKGQITIPATIRRQDRVKPGEGFKIERLARGEYRMVRQTPPNAGLVDWLLACPEKGFLEPVESDSTDEL